MKVSTKDLIETAYTTMKAARAVGIAHDHASAVNGDGTITIRGNNVVNFGSCSYLGIEGHDSLKEGAIEAIRRFGVQFSSSKAYISCELYRTFEEELAKMLRVNRVVIASSTTLTHSAALPIIVEDGDAVLFDALVHSSVQMNIPELVSRGVKVEPCIHNDLEYLERKTKKLSECHRRVIYLCDGVYSMGGEVIDVEAMDGILDRNPSLLIYVDDAHGISWSGINGAGTVLGRSKQLHERMIVTLGLSKGFAASGGAITTSDTELLDRIATCGRTLVFSGPIEPPMLGAGIASAKLHQTNEIVPLQVRVVENIAHFKSSMEIAGLSHLIRSGSGSPIMLVNIKQHEEGIRIIGDVLTDGFYTNCAMFPAVARNTAAIRLVFNAKQSFEQIDSLVDCFARRLKD